MVIRVGRKLQCTNATVWQCERSTRSAGRRLWNTRHQTAVLGPPADQVQSGPGNEPRSGELTTNSFCHLWPIFLFLLHCLGVWLHSTHSHAPCNTFALEMDYGNNLELVDAAVGGGWRPYWWAGRLVRVDVKICVNVCVPVRNSCRKNCTNMEARLARQQTNWSSS